MVLLCDHLWGIVSSSAAAPDSHFDTPVVILNEMDVTKTTEGPGAARRALGSTTTYRKGFGSIIHTLRYMHVVWIPIDSRECGFGSTRTNFVRFLLCSVLCRRCGCCFIMTHSINAKEMAISIILVGTEQQYLDSLIIQQLARTRNRDNLP